jgi:hypothetical protein
LRRTRNNQPRAARDCHGAGIDVPVGLVHTVTCSRTYYVAPTIGEEFVNYEDCLC